MPIKRKVSRGLFIDNGKIIVCKAIDKNNYFLIGGGVKEHECPTKALKREVNEETGKNCEVTKRIGTFYNYYKDQNGYFVDETIFLYKLRIFDCHADRLQLSQEKHIAFYWKDLKNIEEIDLRPNFLINILNP